MIIWDKPTKLPTIKERVGNMVRFINLVSGYCRCMTFSNIEETAQQRFLPTTAQYVTSRSTCEMKRPLFIIICVVDFSDKGTWLPSNKVPYGHVEPPIEEAAGQTFRLQNMRR